MKYICSLVYPKCFLYYYYYYYIFFFSVTMILKFTTAVYVIQGIYTVYAIYTIYASCSWSDTLYIVFDYTVPNQPVIWFAGTTVF